MDEFNRGISIGLKNLISFGIISISIFGEIEEWKKKYEIKNITSEI